MSKTLNRTRRWPLAALAAITLLAALLLTLPAFGGTAEDDVANGVFLFLRDDYDKAIEAFDNAIAKKPDYAAAYTARGNAYILKGQLDKAMADFNKAIALNPKDDNAYSLRAGVYFKTEKYELAIADAAKAIGLNPDQKKSMRYFVDIAKIKLGRGRPSEDLKQGIEYLQKGETDKAIEAFTKDINAKPNAEAYESRATAYMSKRRFSLAIADLSKVITLEPKNWDAYVVRGAAYIGNQQYQNGLDDMNKYAELRPGMLPQLQPYIDFAKQKLEEARQSQK